MINVEELSYRYKHFTMDDISFSLEEGYMMTLLGKNGAGKTTLLQLLYGSLEPSDGKVYWKGEEITGKKWCGQCVSQKECKAEVAAEKTGFREEAAYVGDVIWCVPEWSVTENIQLLCKLYPRWNEERFLEILDALNFSKQGLSESYKALSTGQKMQVQIAFHLARSPKLMLLDEPMANLDVVVKSDLWELLMRYCREQNMAIIISTHLVEEVNEMTDYVGVLKQGHLTAFGEREALLEEQQCSDLREIFERFA